MANRRQKQREDIIQLRRKPIWGIWVFLLLCVPAALYAQAVEDTAAQQLYQRGYRLQQQRKTLEALELYRQALVKDAQHGLAHYEIGWSYWILERWGEAAKHWQIASELKVGHQGLPDYLQRARQRARGEVPQLKRPAINTQVSRKGLGLRLTARFQHHTPRPAHANDRFDAHVFSPKSVQIHPSGEKIYVQALEAQATLVYHAEKLSKLKVIPHHFSAKNAALFHAGDNPLLLKRLQGNGVPKQFNHFSGKPVEGVFSHGGRYLWVSLYRRSYDTRAALPSAVSIIDTRSDSIVRVMPTAAIPKALAVSPDGRQLAVVHWGENTVGLIDISGQEPQDFRQVGEIAAAAPLRLDPHGPKYNRDNHCGLCLRGAVYSADGKHLLVSRMKKGGLAVMDVFQQRLLGNVTGMPHAPRHLVRSPDGQWLFIASSRSGSLSKYKLAQLIKAAASDKQHLPPLAQVYVGLDVRTTQITSDGRWLLAAVNRDQRLALVDAQRMKRMLYIAADPYPVGLAIAPDNSHLWLTAQGRKQQGGNAVLRYQLEIPVR